MVLATTSIDKTPPATWILPSIPHRAPAGLTGYTTTSTSSSSSSSKHLSSGTFRGSKESDAACLQKSIGFLPLKPHQLQVVDRLMKHDVHGVLCAYTVGSGKTLAAIAVAEALRRCYTGTRIKGAVVVVPASLVNNFEKELYKFHIAEVARYDVMSIEKFVNHPPNLADRILIIDEAHNLRNSKGKMSSAIQTEAKKAVKVLLLTGTPVANYPYEIAALLNMIIDPSETMLPTEPLKWNKLLGSTGLQDNDTDLIEPLRSIVAKHVLYYSPSDRRDYPTLSSETTFVAMDEKQALEHQKVAKGIRLTVRNLEKTVTRGGGLPAFFVGPRQISNGIDERGGPKFRIALDRIKQAVAKGRKSLIYSFFLGRGLYYMTALLEEAKIDYAIFSGGETKAQKEDAVKRFNSGSLKVLLISGSGAEGLDLKFTNYVHLMESSWNEAMTQQVIGRACRYKSHEVTEGISKKKVARIPKTVHVYRYISTLPELDGSVAQSLANYKGYKALLHFSADEILQQMALAKNAHCMRFLKGLIRTTS